MKQTKMLFLFLLSIFLLLASGCGAGETVEAEDAGGDASAADDHENEDGHMEGDDHADEHGDSMTHIHAEAPEEFATLENPFAGDHEAIEAGEETFTTLCLTCHGPEGKGDGPGAAELNPKPADLSDGAMMGTLSDGYLFWRVSKGGMQEPFNSAMPAWEDGLTEDQRWQVISFIRTLSAHDDEHMDEEHMDDEHMDDEHMDDEHVEDEHQEEEHMEEDSAEGEHMEEDSAEGEHMEEDSAEGEHMEEDHQEDGS